MSAYLLVLGKATDRDRMAAYSRALPSIYARHGGRYLAIGGAGRGIDWLFGPWRDRSMVLARFDDLEHVVAFWWSAEYRAAARLREQAGQFTVVGLRGATGTSPRPAADQEAAPDAAYLIEATVTRDSEACDAYAARLDAAARALGGHTLASVRDASFTALEGDPLFDRVTVTYFPSASAIDACFADPGNAELAALRERGGVSVVARANSFHPPPPTSGPR